LKKILHEALGELETCGLDLHDINISISTNVNLSGWLGDSEPGDSANQYQASFELCLDENKVTVGHAVCYYISGYDWANEGYSNFIEIADSISEDLLTAVKPVLDVDGSLSSDYLRGGFLYIDKFFIHPDYQNKGIGTLVFPLLLDILGRDAGAITIIPTPTEEDGKGRIAPDDARYSSILNDMCKFIMRLGFFCADRSNRVWVKNNMYEE